MADTKSIIKNRLCLFAYSFLLGVIINAQPLFFNTDATDSLRAYGSTQAQAGSGRFLGHILDMIFERIGFYQPFRFINVLIYIAFLAASAVLIVMILDIKRTSLSLLSVSILMSCAMNSGILAYFYVCHMYGFTLFISMLACFLIIKRRAVILPAVLLSASLGIYQAFFPTVILLIFLCQFLRLSKGDGNIRTWLLDTFRYMVIVLEALIIYIVLNRIYLSASGLSMSGYLNMSENVLPKYTPSQLMGLAAESYRFFFGLPFEDRYFLNDNILMKLSLGFFIGLFLFELIYLLIHTVDNIRRGLMLVLLILYPCFINLPMFMQGNIGERYSLSWYFIFIAPIAFYQLIHDAALGKMDGFTEEKAQNSYIKNENDTIINDKSSLNRNISKIFAAFTALILVFGFSGAAYGAYRNVNIYSSYIKTHEIAENVVFDLEQRLSCVEGFSPEEDEIVFLGSLDTSTINESFFNIEYEEFLRKVFNRDHSSIFKRYALHDYNVITPNDERITKFSMEEFEGLGAEDISKLQLFCINGVHDDFQTIHSGSRELRELPSYPDSGCMRRIGDIVVIKLSD